ncbi:MAG: hypothetical protein K2N96_08555 [Muribaculaceae bacterium]|nr:hypothetical protein [Muribaculaceae bacterium]
MSLASCSYQTTWIPNSSSFTVALLGINGDIWQMYEGDPTAPVNVIPDFVTDKPVIKTILMESDPEVTQANLAAMISNSETKWYVNDVKLVFNATTGISTNFGGAFKLITTASGSNPLASAPYGGLQIIKNLVTALNGQSAVVRNEVALTIGSNVAYVQGSTGIKMIKRTGSNSVADIYCDSSDSFVLTSDHNSVVCKVRCWQGDQQLADNKFTRKWSLLENGAWIQKATTNTFTVNRDMIATFGDVKVECFDTSGKPIASDIQTGADETDPYVVMPNPTPADGVLRASGGPDKIKFEPKLLDLDGVEKTGVKFLFTELDSAGNILNNDTTTKKTSHEIPIQTFINLNEGPLVNITAVEA